MVICNTGLKSKRDILGVGGDGDAPPHTLSFFSESMSQNIKVAIAPVALTAFRGAAPGELLSLGDCSLCSGGSMDSGLFILNNTRPRMGNSASGLYNEAK